MSDVSEEVLYLEGRLSAVDQEIAGLKDTQIKLRDAMARRQSLARALAACKAPVRRVRRKVSGE